MVEPCEVDRVMRDTGMERMQAYRHVQARDVLRERDMRSVVDLAPTLVRYWQEPAFAAALDAETEHHRAEAHAARQIVVKAQWEAVWAREEEKPHGN